ncbi:MAG: hypothetical protein GY765_09355 [bacterium]|nr:hypothetical protein [bacterium]
MTKDELIERLGQFEWKDVEFKRAQNGVPNDAYQTVAAFANTAGGYLVFGIQDTDGIFDIVGVIDVDKVQNDFLTCLRGTQKMNRPIDVKEDAFQHLEKNLLVFYIPESPRREKPVYLKGDIRKTYIRRGSGDERCTTAEIERFLRDSADTSFDNQLLDDIDGAAFFDPPTVAWYRRLFRDKKDDRYAHLGDADFLVECGFVKEVGQRLMPTRASVLLFGKARYVRQLQPGGIVDFQRIDYPFEQWTPEKRWHDREVVEENIIQAWQVLVQKYMRLAEHPFSVDSATLRRFDEPPDYISFREAAINLLVHQDYGDCGRKSVIKIFTDRTIFWNPGDAFVPMDQLLDPTEKEVRNPSIVAAFRRIGLSDQAGTGVRSIMNNWGSLGYVPPRIDNDRSEKTFQLVLQKEQILTEQQRLFQAQLGVHLSEPEAALFAYACRQRSITLTDARAVTGQGNRGALDVLKRLVTMVLLRNVRENERWEIAPHLMPYFQQAGAAGDHADKEKPGLVTDQVDGNAANMVTDQVDGNAANMVTDQVDGNAANMVTDHAAQTAAVAPLLTELSHQQRQIIRACEVPRKQTELMQIVGLTHRSFFRQNHLKPLLQANLLRMTHPDKPTSSNQAYMVTKQGLNLMQSWKKNAPANGDKDNEE